MEARQFQNAVQQVLENYQRCGITRFARRPDSELSDQVLEKIAELRQQLNSPAMARRDVTAGRPRATRPAPAGDGAASSRPAANLHTADVKTADLDTANPGTANLGTANLGTANLGTAIVSTVQQWNLPVLGDSERQSRSEQLAGEVRDCRKCAGIVSYRQQTVFGDGPLRPRVCFMGEAPGADEDRLGKPFVGKAGQLLTKIIQAMQLRREEVYILNALKCRPPQNRTPVQEEIDNCQHFVEQQLEILQPEYIVCLGAVAVRSLLKSTLSIGRLRGTFHQYRGAQVVVTYHPSYLLRNESAKKFVWEDMKMLMQRLAEPVQ